MFVCSNLINTRKSIKFNEKHEYSLFFYLSITTSGDNSHSQLCLVKSKYVFPESIYIDRANIYASNNRQIANKRKVRGSNLNVS